MILFDIIKFSLVVQTIRASISTTGEYYYYSESGIDKGNEETFGFLPVHRVEKRFTETSTTPPLIKDAKTVNISAAYKKFIEGGLKIKYDKKPISPKQYDDAKQNRSGDSITEVSEHEFSLEQLQNSSAAIAETDLDLKLSITHTEDNDNNTNIPSNSDNDLLGANFNNDKDTLKNKFASTFESTITEPFHSIHVEEGQHRYYNSLLLRSSIAFDMYWMNLDKHNETHVNTMLSSSHRRAVTVKLSFEFPFYGHLVNNVTVATGGFLYTGNFVHSWLAATQYVAPLMANFDTSLSNNSLIKYLDTGNSFTVEWHNVILQDEPELGPFTFQVTLLESGDMTFAYKCVPDNVSAISDVYHPVKVGISDAYIMDRVVFSHRHKTLYEYHHISFNRSSITNHTVIHLAALPTCAIERSCSACVQLNKQFDCNWCPSVGRCSDGGMDRWRQDWLLKGCMQYSTRNPLECNKYSAFGNLLTPAKSRSSSHKYDYSDTERAMSVPAILTICFTIIALGGVGLWILYAYRNPHTPSGQFLIKYRPNQWSWRRGEARYTAATIHI